MNKNISTLGKAIGAERGALVVLCLLLAWFPYRVFDKLDIGWIVLIEAVLFSIGFCFLKSYRKHLPAYMGLLVLFCFACELYIRITSFGISGLSFKDYRPAGFGNPFCRLEYSIETYSGLKPDTSAIFKGSLFNVNHHGFRGRSFPFTKPEKTYRILMVGSSGTLGSGVSEQDRFSQLVEDGLNEKESLLPLSPAGRGNYEVINLSLPGTHIGNHLHVIKEIGLKYEPDMIMMLINRANSSKKKLELRPRRPTPYNGPAYRLYTDHRYEYFRSNFFFARLLLLCRRGKLYFSDGGLSQWFAEKKALFIKSSPPDKPDTSQLASEWSELIRGIDMLKTICPHQELVLYHLKPLARLNDPEHDIGYREMISKKAAERQIHVIDTYRADFSGYTAGDLTIYPGDVHPNEIVHGLYAREILKSLKFILKRDTIRDDRSPSRVPEAP